MTHGIKKYCPEAKIVYMRPGGEGGHWEYGDWNMGRAHFRPYSGEGWATNFTCYRWSIPEAAGFEGRAVYCDADQTIHADISELANCELQGKCCAVRKGVIVFDAGHPFWRSGKWPRLVAIQSSGAGLGFYQKLVNDHGGGSSLFPVEWDVLDGREMSVWKAKLNHYTAMQWQPYHPFPDRFKYPGRHPKPEVDDVWWVAYREALAEKAGIGFPPYKKFGNIVQWCLNVERDLGLDCFGREKGFPMWFTDMDEFERKSRELNPHGFRGAGRYRPL